MEITIYRRHSGQCPQKADRYATRCGCPLLGQFNWPHSTTEFDGKMLKHGHNKWSPVDLGHINNTKVSKNELPFVAVAYGLSNIGLSIPEAFTPDQIPPLPDKTGPRLRLDRDDMYAK